MQALRKAVSRTLWLVGRKSYHETHALPSHVLQSMIIASLDGGTPPVGPLKRTRWFTKIPMERVPYRGSAVSVECLHMTLFERSVQKQLYLVFMA